jgi:hypothetical protein
MRLSLFFLVCLFAVTVSAEQTVIADYDDARDNFFYNQLYIGTTGESLYCGIARPTIKTVM